MIRIYCRNTRSYASFQEGTSLLEMIDAFDFARPYPILVAKVNNVTQGLRFRAYNCCDVEFLDYTNYLGRNIYCRSLCFMLCKAVEDLFPGSMVKLQRPISKGYLCNIQKDTPLLDSEIEAISRRMEAIVEQAIPFRRIQAHTEEAIRLFEKRGCTDKARLFETSDRLYTTYYDLDGMPDCYFDALLPDTSYLTTWQLCRFGGICILRVPDRHCPTELAPYAPQPKTCEVFRESLRWNTIMGLETVGDLNKACLEGHATDLIQVSEALQERKLVKMAEEISERHMNGKLKLVLLTGPSSSGKTTICRKLCVQLMACGLHPVSLSTDDYFVNRLDTPKLPDGTYDFDNFDTVDHSLMERELLRMIDGEEVEVPEYNFVTGIREYNGKKIRLTENTVLLVEGIHALNPELTKAIADEYKYKIFINTIVSVSLDHHSNIPTSDNRLLRRILRDYKKGAYSARESIANWPNVRRAETKWIYPFQETADVLFNSAYLVEFAVLKRFAIEVLQTVPRKCPEYGEAARLLNYLSYFVSVPADEIPATSLLREFV